MKNEGFFSFLFGFKKVQKAIGLIHKSYLSQLKTTRKYIAFTKTKSEVRGGGKKPWKQKGTGQARAGSIRSPLYVGGGVIFGPKPRCVFKKVSKKEKVLALIFSFFLKNCFLVENNFSCAPLKTNFIKKMLIESGIGRNSHVLFIFANSSKNFWLAIRNIKNVKISTLKNVSLNKILNAEHIIFLNSKA